MGDSGVPTRPDSARVKCCGPPKDSCGLNVAPKRWGEADSDLPRIDPENGQSSSNDAYLQIRLAVVGQTFDYRSFQRTDPRFQRAVLLARLLRHGLDRLELLALHHIEIAQHALGLGADHIFDLLAHTVGRAGSVGDQLAEFVEEPPCGLRHESILTPALFVRGANGLA